MNWKNETVLVTGACGFIGSHLVEALVRRGAQVKALTFYDPRGSHGWMDTVDGDIVDCVELIQGDVRDAEQMRSVVNEGDTVFHLAALIGIPYSYVAPRSYVETNTTGTLNILEAGRIARRILVTSTSEVYGSAITVPISEDHPLQAQSPYSASKIAAEKLAESYHKSFDVPVVTVRPFNTFGPRQSARAVIPTIVMQALDGKTEIKLGDVSTTRDFNFVEDTAEGLIRLAECDAAVGRVVNIGTGSEIAISGVVEAVSEITGTNMTAITDEQRIRPEKSEVMRLCADNSLLRELTGWAPPVRLKEGLSKLTDWMKGSMHLYESGRYYV